MAMKGLGQFLEFNTQQFFAEKVTVFLKSAPWEEESGGTKRIEGAKVTLQIIEDRTTYLKESIDNYGEQVVIKVRNVDFNAYSQLSPLKTEVVIVDVERATVWGEYKNQLSIIAKISAASGEKQKLNVSQAAKT
jgi:hypothetical protein